MAEHLSCVFELEESKALSNIEELNEKQPKKDKMKLI